MDDLPQDGEVPEGPSYEFAGSTEAPAPAPGTRRAARERALVLLYEADAKGLPPSEVLDELPVRPGHYVVELVSGVGGHRGDIDATIAHHAIGWAPDRMPLVDLTIARLCVYELTLRPDVPTGVVLAEAVELAHRFSTEESGRFLNGLLAAVAADVRAEDAL